MLEQLDNALHANDDIHFYSEVLFIACQRHILATDLEKINLDNDNDFNEDDSDTIIHVKLLTWHSRFKKSKALKKRLAEN